MPVFGTITADHQWQIDHGYAEAILASDLTDRHVGRGLYQQLFRDHDWLYIEKVEHEKPAGSNGSHFVQITWLELEEQPETINGNDGFEKKVNTTLVVRKSVRVAGDAPIVICKDTVKKPLGTRCVTTTTVTRLGDDDIING